MSNPIDNNNNNNFPTNEESNADEDSQPAASEEQAPVDSNQNIGYCHVCDRQVQINQDTFTCGVCNGGFIELFETPPQPQPQQLPNRVNFSSLLPLLLPQLMGQVGAQNITTQRTFGQDQSNNPPTQSATRLQFIVPGEPGGQVDLYGIINNVLSDMLMRPGVASGGIPHNTQFHFQPPPIRMFQLHGDMRDYAWGAGGLDTIITQLLNQLENTGPPPATEQQLFNLPVVKINDEEFEKKVECAICMEDFNLHEEAKKLPCKHYFHEPCISEWLKLHGTCPVCRKNLNGEDTSQREYISSPPPPTPGSNSETTTSTTSEGSTTNTASNLASNNQSTNENANSASNPEVYHDMDFD